MLISSREALVDRQVRRLCSSHTIFVSFSLFRVGVLSPLGHIAPPPLPSSSSSQNESPAVAQASQANNKFGAPSTQTINQLPSVESAATFNRNKESSASKFSGSFGGPPGVLKPFDK